MATLPKDKRGQQKSETSTDHFKCQLKLKDKALAEPKLIEKKHRVG